MVIIGGMIASSTITIIIVKVSKACIKKGDKNKINVLDNSLPDGSDKKHFDINIARPHGNNDQDIIEQIL